MNKLKDEPDIWEGMIDLGREGAKVKWREFAQANREAKEMNNRCFTCDSVGTDGFLTATEKPDGIIISVSVLLDGTVGRTTRVKIWLDDARRLGEWMLEGETKDRTSIP
jgi:hypothetical protein